ncbi:nucleotidyltransferase domain-containing protein, partial [Bacteroidota bacterium]
RNDSDWDILILIDKEHNTEIEDRIRERIFDIELDIEEPISTLIYSKSNWANLEITPLFQNIKAEGIRA